MRSRVVLSPLAVLSICAILASLASPILAEANTIPPECARVFPHIPRNTQAGPSGGVIDAETCRAYEFLITRYDIGSRSAPCIRSKEQGIGGMNPDFAKRLAAMIQAMDAQLGGQVRVNSALRPRPCDTNGNHVYGCAADLQYPSRPGSSATDPTSPHVRWIDANANDPRYKIHLRLRFSPEWNHVEPIDIQACRAGASGDPNIMGRTPPPPTLASMFAPPPPAQQCAPGMMLMNGQCLPQQNTGLGSSLSQPPPVSSGSSGTGGTPVTGGTGGTVTGGTGVSSTGSTNVNTNTNTNTGGAISSIDLINSIAYPSSTLPTTATGSAITLISAISGNVATIQGQPAVTQIATNTVVLGGAPVQTFTSQDLSKTPVTRTPVAQNTFAWQILEQLRQTLVKILALLQPFGGTPFAYGNHGSDTPGVEHSE